MVWGPGARGCGVGDEAFDGEVDEGGVPAGADDGGTGGGRVPAVGDLDAAVGDKHIGRLGVSSIADIGDGTGRDPVVGEAVEEADLALARRGGQRNSPGFRRGAGSPFLR